MENQNVQGQPPKTWLVESILVTILCCLPFGIIGIINASKVEAKFNEGAVDEAKKLSQDAGKWTKIGFFLGLAVYVIVIIMYAIMGAALFAAASSGGY
ncbi:MAG: CD225/dispanin family protein [Bacteroidales bacterium]|nr:CD225/dispanin family protein [Bacteroidales bacterium]